MWNLSASNILNNDIKYNNNIGIKGSLSMHDLLGEILLFNLQAFCILRL